MFLEESTLMSLNHSLKAAGDRSTVAFMDEVPKKTVMNTLDTWSEVTAAYQYEKSLNKTKIQKWETSFAWLLERW